VKGRKENPDVTGRLDRATRGFGAGILNGKENRPGRLTALLCAALLLCCAAGAEAFSVRALVDRTRIAPDESVELRVVMTDGSGEVDTSVIRDFEVLYRGQSSSLQIVNQDVRRELTRTYLLTPKREGTLRIPALPVRTGSGTVRTSPIVIRVEPAAAAAAAEDLLLTASVSAARPFVGQEIVYSFRFMAAVPVTNARYHRPSFEGFEVTEIDAQKEYETIRNGRRFSVTEVSYLLTPTRSGELTIEPGVISCDVPESGRGRLPSLFDDPFFRRFRTVRRSVRSPSIPVSVRPLPPWRGKGAFSGLIGSFELSATVRPARVAAGDSATIEVRLEGRGNVQDASPPSFEPPPGVKVYPDTPELDLKRDAAGSRGSRSFRFAVVPLSAGRLRFGPFAYDFFDPESGSYRTVRTERLELEVEPAASEASASGRVQGGRPGRGEPSPPAGARSRVRATGHDILTVHADPAELRRSGSASPALFLFLLFLPPLAVFAGRALRLRGRRRIPEGLRMRERALSALSAAEREGDAVRRLGGLHRALVSAVFARIGRAGESFTHAEARRWLGEAGMAPGEVDEVMEALLAVEAARYGGADREVGELSRRVGRVVRLLCGGRAP